jgi:hypothetical protein
MPQHPATGPARSGTPCVACDILWLFFKLSWLARYAKRDEILFSLQRIPTGIQMPIGTMKKNARPIISPALSLDYMPLQC